MSRSATLYIDKLKTGFLAWGPTFEAYVPRTEGVSTFHWEEQSLNALNAIEEVINQSAYFDTLLNLWGQESNSKMSENSELSLRLDNIMWIKSVGALCYQYILSAFLLNLKWQQKCLKINMLIE